MMVHTCKDVEKQENLHIAYEMLFGTITSGSKLVVSTKAEGKFTLHSSVSTPKFIHKKNSYTCTRSHEQE